MVYYAAQGNGGNGGLGGLGASAFGLFAYRPTREATRVVDR